MSTPLTALDDAAWDSPWRHRRVVDKVVTSLSLVLAALVSPTWPGTIIVAVVSCLFILVWAKVPVRVLWQAMFAPVAFLLIGGISVAVTVGGVAQPQEWWRRGSFAMSPTSLRTATGMFAHGVSGTLAIMVLATTTPLVDILTWMRRLHLPDALLEIASLTYRLVFVFLDSLFCVVQAHQARLGDAPQGARSWRRRWDNTAALVGVVALRSWGRATRLQEGMVNRGFESSFTTLPLPQRRSPLLLISGVTAALATWVISWAVSGHPWR